MMGDLNVGPVLLQSEFLELVVTGEQAVAALALARETASDAHADQSELERMLAWLTGAHAEEMAMHRMYKAEVRLRPSRALPCVSIS